MSKVSVIMGIHNGSEGIKAAIESILNQSFSDFELIVCDDGSSDNSVEIVEELAVRDNRIILLKNHKNLKLPQTLNKCLNIAKSEYIARMDDDDISHPERFKKQVAFLDSHPEYALVGTSCNMCDSEGVWGKRILAGERSKVDIYSGRIFVHPSVMMRKNAILSVNGYSTEAEIGRAEDYDLWCKLYAKGFKGYNMSDIMLDYYEARDSYSKRKYKFRICEYKLKKKWRKGLGLPVSYSIHAYRPLIVGLLPVKISMKYREKKFHI